MVARVGGLEPDRRVVEQLAAREGIPAAEAEARALDQLRYVAARRAELDARETPPEHPDDLDPARRAHLERAAMVRLWLAHEFEPTHEADDIPARVVAQNLADPSVAQRMFHPELWFICQVLIVPAALGEDGRHVAPPSAEDEPDASAQWFADANAAFAPVVARLEALGGELETSEDECEFVARIIGGSVQDLDTPSGAMKLRFERFAFTPAAKGLDPGWLEQVTRRREPGLVGPFASQFGVHLVLLDLIRPASLADGSLPEAELQAAREAELRTQMRDSWRTDELQRALANARDRRVVRLATGLE